jgi:ferric-dicitrate binding protein FerR (iron transport regulator)
MNQNHFWNLLSKHLSGEASADETAELEALIKAHPDLSYSAQHLTDLWRLSPATDLKEAETAFKKHMEQLANHVDKQGENSGMAPVAESVANSWFKKPLVYFSVAALFLLAIVLLWPKTQTPANVALQTQAAEVSTRAGSRTRLLLPDSSVVWLNAGSRLTYNQAFGITHRNTTLTGEAFFDVRKSTMPFIIQANGVRIKVLGTAFNVKSYASEEKTETSLIRGRVEVTIDKRPGEKFILKPNEKLTIATGAKPAVDAQQKQPIVVLDEVTHLKQNLILETSWVENKLVFQDETFAEVARKMERWYDVEISLTDKKLAALHVGGGPFENESIEQALTALQIAFDFSFTISGKKITITR